MALKKSTLQRKLVAAKNPSNFVQTKMAKKTPGRSVRVGGIQVIKSPGKKPLPFKRGGLHATLGVDPSKKIPENKLKAALDGKFGDKGAQQARFYLNVLKKGQRTAAKNRQK